MQGVEPGGEGGDAAGGAMRLVGRCGWWGDAAGGAMGPWGNGRMANPWLPLAPPRSRDVGHRRGAG